MSDEHEIIGANCGGARINIGLPAEGWLTEEEFEVWFKEPGNPDAVEAWIRQGCPNPEAPPARIHRALRIALRRRDTAILLRTVDGKLGELMTILQDETLSTEETTARCTATFQQITDLLLETPEPHRTTFLQSLLPLRDQLCRKGKSQ